jgi:glucose/arabinose dehydrogenase
MRSKLHSAMTAVIALGLASSALAATPLTSQLVMSGFARPIWAGSPPDDKSRIFVCEQHTGLIRIIKDGALLATPFIDIKALNGLTTGNEQGLLGFAFHPNYEVNGHFYVNYTTAGIGSVIKRYTRSSSNPDLADVNSGSTLITIAQPFSNHNGGHIVFGTDGYLWAGFGDGGSSNDPQCNAQNELSRLGKMLRLDVDNPPTYVPATNPFVGMATHDPLIWATGIRNPWRFDIDPANGDLYIGDVGQNAVEEIDWVPGSSTGGENYGWRVMEGNNCPNTQCQGAPACNSPLYTDPVHTYTHSGGACSVTGGVVYRGCAIPDLVGTYFFADYCSGQKWSFRIQGGAVTEFTNRTAEIEPPGTPSIGNITHFGRDACGEILITDQAQGEIWKIVPAILPAGTIVGPGKVGGNGLVPSLTACGLLDTGNTAKLEMTDGPANRIAVLFVSLTQGASPFFGGTLVPGLPVLLTLSFVTNSDGDLNFGNVPGGGGPISVYTQIALDDPGATAGVGLSNALRLNYLP